MHEPVRLLCAGAPGALAITGRHLCHAAPLAGTGLGPRRHQSSERPRRHWEQAWAHLAGETWWRNAEAWPTKVAAEVIRGARVPPR